MCSLKVTNINNIKTFHKDADGKHGAQLRWHIKKINSNFRSRHHVNFTIIFSFYDFIASQERMMDHPDKIFLPNNAQSILLISVSVCLQTVTMKISVLDQKDFLINALLSLSSWLTQLHLTSGSTEHLVSCQIQLFSWRLREYKLLCPSFLKQIFLLCKTLLQIYRLSAYHGSNDLVM